MVTLIVVFIILAIIGAAFDPKTKKNARIGRQERHGFKDSHKKRANTDINNVFKKIASGSTPIDLTFTPPLNIKKGYFPVKSMTSDNIIYQVSLELQTCTCQDFERRRKKAAINHLYRFCKHLLTELDKSNAFDDSSEWVKVVVECGFGAPTTGCIIQLNSAPQVAAFIGNSNEWINIYAHSLRQGERIANASGEINRYGWSVIDQRWANGDSPPGSRELKKRLCE